MNTPRTFFFVCATALSALSAFPAETNATSTYSADAPESSSAQSTDVANESQRERSRVLLKRNPIASEYQTFGDLGKSRGADADGEGADFRSYFKSGFALDASEQRRATVATYYSDQSSVFKPGGSLDIREIFGDDSDWAVEFSIRNSVSDRIFEHYQSNWNELLELDSAGNRILDANNQAIAQTNALGEKAYYLDRLQMTTDRIYTRSNLYKFRLEHAWSGNHRSFFEASVTDYFANSYRNRSEIRFPQNAAEPGFGDAPQGSSTSITEGRYTDASIRRVQLDTDNNRLIQRYLLGGQIEDDDWTLDYNFYAGKFENKTQRYDWNFYDRGLEGTYSINDPYLPDFSLTRNGQIFDIRDISQANFSSLRTPTTTTTDTDYAARIDFDTEIDVGSTDSYLSSGFLYRKKTRNNKYYGPVYGANPNATFTLEDLQDDFDPGYIVEGTYPLSRGMATDEAKRFFENNPGLFILNRTSTELESARQLYNANEAVSGYYIESSLGFGALRVNAGSRIEYTETKTTGTNIDPNNQIYETTQRNDYWNLLPTIEATYSVSPKLKITGSWYEALMRPQYYDIVPYERINFPNRTIARGNPDLEPTMIDSYQIAVEYTHDTLGKFGSEIYYKKISDFFYHAESTEQYNGATFSNKRIGNGDDGTIYGVQLQYSKDLDFLDPIFDGGRFSLAYTLSESKATVPTRPDEEILVPGRSKHNLLTSLDVIKGPFLGGVSLGLQSYSLDKVGNSRGEDQFREKTIAVDAHFGYKITDNLSFGLKLFNLTDHPERAYMGNSTRVVNNQFSSWGARLSLAMDF